MKMSDGERRQALGEAVLNIIGVVALAAFVLGGLCCGAALGLWKVLVA